MFFKKRKRPEAPIIHTDDADFERCIGERHPEAAGRATCDEPSARHGSITSRLIASPSRVNR